MKKIKVDAIANDSVLYMMTADNRIIEPQTLISVLQSV